MHIIQDIHRCGSGIAGDSIENSIIENVYNVGRTGIICSSGEQGTYISPAITTHLGNVKHTLKNVYYLQNETKTAMVCNDTSQAGGQNESEELEQVSMISLGEFEKQETFVGFDFENNWEMSAEGNYKFPVLKNVKHIEKEENTTDFAGGNGTYYNPYLISTPSHLNSVRNDLYACYKLTNDIDLEYDIQNENGLFYNNGKGWAPIGNPDTGMFKGVLDGNDYRIINLRINDLDLRYAGLFGKTQRAIIKNLKMTYSEIKGGSFVGNLAGAMNSSIIYNISSSGNISGNYSGGIVGDSGWLLVKECFNSSNVCGYSTASWYTTYSGGITNSDIEYGLIKIEDSYNTGKVKALNKGVVGGIIGKTDSPTRCTNVYNVGTLKNEEEYIGNIIGQKSSYIDDTDFILEGCYHLDNEILTVGNDEECTNEENVKALEEMKIQSTFSEFDFENIWEITENRFPTLKSSNNVYVSQIDVDDIVIGLEEEKKIEFSFMPEIVDNAVFKYSIDNEEIATVSNEGIVYGLEEGNTTINITTVDESISKTINLTVTGEKSLTGITVTKAPTNTTYIAGQNFDSTGMVVTATYNDGTSKEVTNYEITDGDSLTVGKTSVTISYTENGVTKTATQGITVNEDHTWNIGEVTKEPTCKDKGEKTYTCTVCGKTKTEEIAVTDNHTWNSGEVAKEPTCKDKGEKTYTCTVCGETRTEEIAVTNNHTWNTGKVTKEPTCKDKGEKTYTCTVCGETRTEEIAVTDNHTWDSGEVTKEPTCKDKGEKIYTCTVCNKTKIQEIAETGHKYENGVCVNCGENIFTEESKYYIILSELIGISPNTIIGKFITNIMEKYTVKIIKDNQEVTEGKIATGMQIKIFEKEQEVDSCTAVVTGDTDGNGNADIRDMIKINNYRLYGTTTNFEGAYQTAGDVNRDGKIDIKDMIRINNYRLYNTSI